MASGKGATRSFASVLFAMQRIHAYVDAVDDDLLRLKYGKAVESAVEIHLVKVASSLQKEQKKLDAN
jgi:hypothetical protein